MKVLHRSGCNRQSILCSYLHFSASFPRSAFRAENSIRSLNDNNRASDDSLESLKFECHFRHRHTTQSATHKIRMDERTQAGQSHPIQMQYRICIPATHIQRGGRMGGMEEHGNALAHVIKLSRGQTGNCRKLMRNKMARRRTFSHRFLRILAASPSPRISWSESGE